MLRLEEGELDADRAQALLAGAREAGSDAVELLREAERLWRGPPLADLAYESFAQTAIARLDELRLTIQEERIGYELELGREGDLVGELEVLVVEHPLRERLRAQLMLALYRSRAQADALHAYQDARRKLLDQLGIEPGSRFRRCTAAILRQDRSLELTPARAEPGDVGTGRADAARRPARPGPRGRGGGAGARLAERFEVPDEDSAGLTRVAQYVALMKGSGPLYDELRELLAATAVPTSIHRFFAAVPPLLRERGAPQQLIVTTSYDLALEQAFLDAGEEFDVVSYLAVGRNRGKFCHIAPDGNVHVIDVPNRYATELEPERRTVIFKLHGGCRPRRTNERGKASS